MSESRSGGWIKLWRKARDSDVFADPNLWHLFCWCLFRANHKPRQMPVNTGRGSTVVALDAGQFITGRKTGASELKLAPSTFRRRLGQLTELGVISVKADTHYSIVNIVNWDIYQTPDGENGQATVQATVQATDTDKNVKNEKKSRSAPEKRFCKPSIEEIRAYCSERRNTVDPELWFARYESNGWMVGKSAMKDWKASIRYWERNGFPQAAPAKKSEPIKYRA